MNIKGKAEAWLMKWKVTIIILLIMAPLAIPALKVLDTYRQTRIQYDWSTAHYGMMDSDEPFGALYLHQWLKEIWKGEVTVEKDLIETLKKNNGKPCNYIVFEEVFTIQNYNDDSIAHSEAIIMAEAVNNGCNVMWMNDRSGEEFFNVNCQFNRYFYPNEFLPKSDRPTLLTCRGFNGKDSIQCQLWSNMICNFISKNSGNASYGNKMEEFEMDQSVVNDYTTRYDPLLITPDSNNIVLRQTIGKGRITFIGAHALLSNYTVSNNNMIATLRYLIDSTFDRSLPLVIIFHPQREKAEAERNFHFSFDNSETMFYALLQHKETALMLWIMTSILAAGLIVNARRKRAAAPQRENLPNSSITYIEHLATLYNAHTDYHELLVIEQRMLFYRLQKEYRFDIRTHHFTLPSQFAPMIAKSKDIDEPTITSALQHLERLTASNARITRKQYLSALTSLNIALQPPSP